MEHTKRFISTLMLTVIVSSLITVSGMTTKPCEATSTEYWALLVMSGQPGDITLRRTADYAYHVVDEHYDFDGIYYLHSDNSTTGVNATSTMNNTRWAITDWLKNTSDSDDIIFIYFVTHGAGYYDNTDVAPRDQWHYENHNGRGSSESDGYDEGLNFYINQTGQWEYYYDDELVDDLSTLNYSKLVFTTASCFGDGVASDVVADDPQNRVSLTATSENLYAYKELDAYKTPKEDDGFCEWSEVFLDALHGEDTYWDADDGIVHQGVSVDADENDDGHVTMLEAWEYARDHDDARNQTFIEELKTQNPPPVNWYDQAESPKISNKMRADAIWFPKKRSHLRVKTFDITEEELEDVDFWLDDSQTALQSPKLLHVTFANHTVEVDDTVYMNNRTYIFDHWALDNSTGNPITVDVSEDVCLIAYYEVIYNVTFTNITTCKTIVGQGYVMHINTTVKNQDSITLAFNVTVYANTTTIGSQNVTLDSEESTTLTFTWNTTSFDYSNYTVKAIAGTDECTYDTLEDGTVLVTIPGDVNGDRAVDIFDVGKYSAHKTSPPPGPGGYDPNVDINHDGEIDDADLDIILAHWGQSW